jgi:acetyltransferase EpsM
MATSEAAAQAADRHRPDEPASLIVIGGGEHARVVIEAARTRPDQWTISGYVDPVPVERTTRLTGAPHLGDDRAIDAALAEGSVDDRPWVVLGVGGAGSPGLRQRLVERLDARAATPVRWATIVHSGAWVSPTARLGPGTVVLAGAIVNSGAAIGAHAIVNTAAVVEHDVVIGDFTHVAPAAVVGGGASLGRDGFVGLGARIRDHVTIGDGATIGMAAAVVDDVAAGVTVVGSPAKPMEPDRA